MGGSGGFGLVPPSHVCGVLVVLHVLDGVVNLALRKPLKMVHTFNNVHDLLDGLAGLGKVTDKVVK